MKSCGFGSNCQSPDAGVIAKAQQLDAILLSLNGNFADIVTFHRI
jgi:hypothetical protein